MKFYKKWKHRQTSSIGLSVHFSLVAQSSPPLFDPMNCSTPGLPVHHQLPELTQTHVHRLGDAIQLSHSLSSPSPPAPNPSQHQSLFQWVNSSHEVAKVLEFQPQHQSFNEHPGLISFRMDWLDLLPVQGTLKSLLQHHISKASILQCSAFFTVQLSHSYMTTGKTIALTRQTFVGKVISLLFNMLSRLVITFLHQKTNKQTNKNRITLATINFHTALMVPPSSSDLPCRGDRQPWKGSSNSHLAEDHPSLLAPACHSHLSLVICYWKLVHHRSLALCCSWKVAHFLQCYLHLLSV